MLLDLVRDPGVLTQRVCDHGLVLVELAGSSSVPGGHLASQINGCCASAKHRKGEKPVTTSFRSDR